ncbi:unnamed protein product [Auanema sp. JU1783]|nr:unnamed protein product [Auanema sp. JU1783]
MVNTASNGREPNCRKVEVLGSLPLQMSLFYNAYFCPIFLVIGLASFILKYNHLSTIYQVILTAMYIIYYTVEVVRLFLGYYGNLGGKIPALSGFWTTSLVLQLPISLFLQINSSIIPLPVERALYGLHTMFILSQLFFGVTVIRRIARRQIEMLKRLLEED